MKKERPSPIKWLKQFTSKYPNAWKSIDKVHQFKGKEGIDSWPDWCYCPFLYTYTTLKTLDGGQPVAVIKNGSIKTDYDRLNNYIVANVLAAWRQTQGVYHVNKEVFDSLGKTPITGEIPIEVLYHLPEWCVYIEFPENKVFNPEAKGFFALLDYNVAHSLPELVLLVDYGTFFSPHNLLLNGTISSSFEQTLKTGESDAVKYGMSIDEYRKTFPQPKEYTDNVTKILSPFISLLLYLCSEASDIKSPINEAISFYKTKRSSVKTGFRNLDTYNPKVWEVGYRVGAILNAAKEKTAQPENLSETDSHNSPKPHVRRAHWHGYWVGSGKEKTFTLKWLHPILVGTRTPDEIVATSRNVL